MSVKIRLAKIGKRHAPAYRVVVTPTRTKRNGKYLDILGFYNPLDPNTKFTYDKKLYEEWIEKGALPTKAVADLIANKYEYVKYDPKALKKASEASKEGTKEEVAETQESEETTEETTETPKEE